MKHDGLHRQGRLDYNTSMRSRARKLAASGIAVLAVAVIVATVAASWGLIMEQVYLWRLSSENPKRREAAAERLIEIGSVRVVPYLIETFGETVDADGYETSAFQGTPLMDMLRRRGVDVKTSGLSDQFGDFERFGRVQSVLGEIAKKKPVTVDYFLEGLQNEHGTTRALCAFLIGEAGTESEEVVARLAERLTDQSPFVRHVAVVVLGTMGPQAGPHLVSALADRDGNVRTAAVYALERIGAPVVAELIAALRGTNEVARIYAVYVLGRIGPAAGTSVADLIRVVADRLESDTLRTRAAMALGTIGLPTAAPAVPALVEMLETAPSPLGKTVGSVLVRLANPEAISSLVDLLQSGEESRTIVAFTLAQIGPSAAPELVGALAHESASVRAAALSALGEIGPEPPLVVPAVIRSLDDEDEVVQQAAASALESFSRSGDEEVRRTVEEALVKAGLHRPRRPRRRFP